MPKKGYIHGGNTFRDIHETKNTKLSNNLAIEAYLWNIYIKFVLNVFGGCGGLYWSFGALSARLLRHVGTALSRTGVGVVGVVGVVGCRGVSGAAKLQAAAAASVGGTASAAREGTTTLRLPPRRASTPAHARRDAFWKVVGGEVRHSRVRGHQRRGWLHNANNPP